MTVLIYYSILIGIALFLLFSCFYISGLLYSILHGAPYVPTKGRQLHEILKRAKLKKGGEFLELGCGDGRVVSMAVSEFGMVGKGIEINPLLIVMAKARTWLYKLDNIEFIRQNIRKTDFHGYDAIYLYLFPALIEDIQDKLIQQAKKGATIISHGFRIPALKDNLFDIHDVKPFKTFYYKI